MPIHTNTPPEPSVQPARDRPLTPDTHSSALGLKLGGWCDKRGVLWENYEAEGNSIVEQRHYGEVENLLHAEIEQAERIGSLNPHLACSLNELGILYAKQHKYAQAEPMFQRSLGVCVAVLGSDHPDVAVILKNFGILKASQKNYVEADLLLKQSLLLTKRALGQDHPIAAGTMRTIAVFQAVQGHYGEAEPFIRRSLEISEKTLGPTHPEVVASRKVFARVLRTVHRGTDAQRAESQDQDIGTRSPGGN
ncbi:MAG TPA: tetratricopeptide repeat protein [Nitrospiraceae bacterium]|nr:tetratricopeptide repeat protein [Nitrospiraceae bacterium]